MADAATAAAEADMLRRYPKADLHSPGTGFAWSHFLPALEAAVEVARTDERARIIALARDRAATCVLRDENGDMTGVGSFADLLEGSDG